MERPRLAVVLGAGKAYDLPLEELARRFERLVLVDIDAGALAATAAATLRKPAELRAMDITGVTARLAGGITQALSSEKPEVALEALCGSYRLVTPPRLLAPGERADLLISGMVLSQLCVQPKLAAKRLYEARFGAARDSNWTRAFDQLERRMQQDHIDALTEDADLAVLTTDVVHRSGGEVWSVIGCERLEERVPAFQEVLARGTWTWPRVRGAVETSVDALLLRRR